MLEVKEIIIIVVVVVVVVIISKSWERCNRQVSFINVICIFFGYLWGQKI